MLAKASARPLQSCAALTIVQTLVGCVPFGDLCQSRRDGEFQVICLYKIDVQRFPYLFGRFAAELGEPQQGDENEESICCDARAGERVARIRWYDRYE